MLQLDFLLRNTAVVGGVIILLILLRLTLFRRWLTMSLRMSLGLYVRYCSGPTPSTARFPELPVHSFGNSVIYQCLQFFTSDVNPGMTVGLLRFGHVA
ncbi:hypothetical protein HanRHA438_Chr01g0033391 [Helianthus annuus]|nr:hypothetical protein HanRHA438_Chr01g0033391 [Helianthus annuus]